VTSHDVTMLFLGLALIFVVCQALGALARRLGQPPVVGEILAGILVGPTLLQGMVADTLFPLDVRPMLGALASVGVALFMFLVGLELDRQVVRAQGRVVVSLTLGSLLVPFGLGVLLALWLVRSHPTGDRLGFVLFVGTAMAVTAFPVLARIIVDRGMDRSRVGGLALATAAVGDVIAWTLLAVIVASVGAGGTPWRLLLVPIFVALMATVVPWLVRRQLARHGSGPAVLVPILAGVLVAGAATEWLGLHFIFGAFLLGAVVPRDGTEQLRAELNGRVGQLAVLLMPIYFVVAGFEVDLSGLGAAGLAELGLILLVAMGGKFAGVYAAARFSRLDVRSSAALATLMNVRGLTELVLLTVGLQIGILDPRMYSLMVAMAVLTTVMCGPLLRLIRPAYRVEPEVAGER
jgi:Kef-type K+ transport system membrane component KefB